MAKTAFFSFHYERDSFRVQQVLQMGVLEGQQILNSQEWEGVKRRGDAAIEKWIDEQMKYKGVVVVLAGKETAGRRWVQHEISKAWNEKRAIVGVRIHGLSDGKTVDSPGVNPFSRVGLRDSAKTVADYVPLFDPAGTTSQERYADIKQNLESWVSQAYKRS